jgi:hypothetical protein
MTQAIKVRCLGEAMRDLVDEATCIAAGENETTCRVVQRGREASSMRA